jgi:hypothetical protein
MNKKMLYVVCLAVMLVSPLMAMGVDEGSPVITRDDLALSMWEYAQRAHLPSFADDGSLAPDKAVSWAMKAGVFDSRARTTLPATGAELNRALHLIETTSIVAAETLLDPDAFFSTGKTQYTIHGHLSDGNVRVYNRFEDTSYDVTDDGVSVILTGLSNESWVTSLRKVLTTYTKGDGTPYTENDFLRSKGTDLELTTISALGTNFARFIPADTVVEVHTAWGDVLYANRAGVPHGAGDYLVCSSVNGVPDFSDVWVVNGATFPVTYDMTNAR